MTNNLEPLFKRHEGSFVTSERFVASEVIQTAVTSFVEMNETNMALSDEERTVTLPDFGKEILQLIDNPVFPRALFDQDQIDKVYAQIYPDTQIRLDSPFLAGLYAALNPNDTMDGESWKALATQRQTAIEAQPGEQIVPMAVIETKMLGHLIGKKRLNGNQTHLPSGFNTEDQELANLNRLANHLYPAFQPELGDETSTIAPQIFTDAPRS